MANPFAVESIEQAITDEGNALRSIALTLLCQMNVDLDRLQAELLREWGVTLDVGSEFSERRACNAYLWLLAFRARHAR